MTPTSRAPMRRILPVLGASIALALAGCAASRPEPAPPPPADDRLPPKPRACLYRPKVPNLVENGDADIWMGKAIVVIQTAETSIATCDGYADDLAAAKGGAAKPGAK